MHVCPLVARWLHRLLRSHVHVVGDVLLPILQVLSLFILRMLTDNEICFQVRRAQLEQQYAQRMMMARSGGPAGMPPGAAAAMYPPGTPVFYAPHGGMPTGPHRPGMVYQAMMPRGYRGPMPGGPRPGYQQVPSNYVQGVPPAQNRQGGRQNRQGRQGGQAGQMPTGGQKGGPAGAGGSRPRAQKAQAGANAPQAKAAAPVAAAPAPPTADQPLTTAHLAAAQPEMQKQILGERLFPLVHRLQPEMAGKITGMLLEMDNTELLNLLESPDSLSSKVDEAMAVLRQHGVLPEEGAEAAAQ